MIMKNEHSPQLNRILTVILACLLLAGLASAEQTRLTGPVSGFVFDAHAGAIRPVIGVAGSAYLGGALVEGVELASFSPDGKRVLAAIDGNWMLGSWNVQGLSWTRLSDGALEPERIAWSDSGEAVAAYSGSGRLWLWQDAGEGLRASELGEVPAGKLTAMAVSDAGSLLIGVEGAAGGGVYLLTPGEQTRLLLSAARPSGLAFSRDGADLFVTDRDRNELIQIRDYRGAAAAALFANRNLGLSDPVAVSLSADRKGLLVANSGTRTLAMYELASGALTGVIELDFEPTRLELLGGSSLLLLNSRAGLQEPLRVLETGPEPAVYFIPAESSPVED